MSGCILIAGGGTGGHLFPGVAVALEMRRMRPELDIRFVGSGKALESRILSEAGFETTAISAKALRGRGLMGKASSLASVPGSVLAARKLIKQYRPGLVLAVGGYAAFSLGMAARLSGVPLAVQEQNAIPGLTNQTLGKFAGKVFIAFEEAGAYFNKGRTDHFGNPVRNELMLQASKAAEDRGKDGRFTLLILGGSQGAHAINQAVMDALPLLKDLGERISFIHQTGEADFDLVKNAYAEHGFDAQVKPFFKDMGRLYGLAHLIICRAGAGTITELCAVGRPAICVPYPFAAGDHQTANAKSLVNAGGGKLLPESILSGSKIAESIKKLEGDESALKEMESRAAALGKPEAASLIAQKCLELAGV